MTTWLTMKDYILEGLLKDDPAATVEDRRYTDAQLLIWARWACNELSLHTAQYTTATFTGTGTAHTFTAPADSVEPLSKGSMMVYLEDASTAKYLLYRESRPKASWPTGLAPASDSKTRYYSEYPSGTICLSFIPAAGTSLKLSYFKIWDAPVNDNSVIPFPTMLEQPFAYLVAALAMEPLGVQASNIRQWNRKVDSGTPEHNPLLRQQEHFIKEAYRFLAKLPPQDRETFFRLDENDQVKYG